MKIAFSCPVCKSQDYRVSDAPDGVDVTCGCGWYGRVKSPPGKRFRAVMRVTLGDESATYTEEEYSFVQRLIYDGDIRSARIIHAFKSIFNGSLKYLPDESQKVNAVANDDDAFLSLIKETFIQSDQKQQTDLRPEDMTFL